MITFHLASHSAILENRIVVLTFHSIPSRRRRGNCTCSSRSKTIMMSKGLSINFRKILNRKAPAEFSCQSQYTYLLFSFSFKKMKRSQALETIQAIIHRIQLPCIKRRRGQVSAHVCKGNLEVMKIKSKSISNCSRLIALTSIAKCSSNNHSQLRNT